MKLSLVLLSVFVCFLTDASASSFTGFIKNAMVVDFSTTNLKYHSWEWNSHSQYVDGILKTWASPNIATASITGRYQKEVTACLKDARMSQTRVDLYAVGFPEINIIDASCVNGFNERYQEEISHYNRIISKMKVKQSGNALDPDVRSLIKTRLLSKINLPLLSESGFSISKNGFNCKVSLGYAPGIDAHAPQASLEEARIFSIDVSEGGRGVFQRRNRKLAIKALLVNGETLRVECMKLGKSAKNPFTIDDVQHEILGSGVTLLAK